MRKTGWLAITTLVLTVSLAGFSAAMGPGGGSCGPMGHGPKIECLSKCLDLTEEQTKEIEKVLSGRKSEGLSVRNELTRATHELKGEMLKTHPDVSVVRKLTGKIGELKGRMRLVALERQLAIRKILTDEQIEKMIACHGMSGFGHGEKGHGSRCRSGHGGPMGHGPRFGSGHGGPAGHGPLGCTRSIAKEAHCKGGHAK